jgi:mono/diheme cytochrome c family protein
MKRIVALCSVVIAVGLTWSCAHSKEEAGAKTQAPATSGGTRSIELPHYQPMLPAGEGRDAFAVGCLSCHTTRYITMQPPLSAAKWEESVRKMIKVYNAPIAEDQVQPIVQYLMAAKEKGPPGAWETPAVAPPAVTLTLAPGALSADPSAHATETTHGKLLFGERCASCHGLGGDAKTPAVQTMLPQPTNLTGGRYSAERLTAVIEQGVPGTAMPGYPKWSQDDLRDLILFTQKLAGPDTSAPVAPAHDQARALYAQHCVSCHGKTGAGDGYAAPPLARSPANFHLHQPSAGSALKTITEGVAGTAMPAWKSKLNDAQRALLADYVRTFYSEATGQAAQPR